MQTTGQVAMLGSPLSIIHISGQWSGHPSLKTDHTEVKTDHPSNLLDHTIFLNEYIEIDVHCMNVSSLLRASVCSESKQGWVKSQLLQIFGPNDNKLAMKLFGSKKALMRPKVGFIFYLSQFVKVRQKRVQNWVIHPMSQFR